MSKRRYEQHQCGSCGLQSDLVNPSEVPIGWVYIPELFVGDGPPMVPVKVRELSLCPDCSPLDMDQGALNAKGTGEPLKA